MIYIRRSDGAEFRRIGIDNKTRVPNIVLQRTDTTEQIKVPQDRVWIDWQIKSEE
jgi:hypothetical protein